jgi:protoporphyrinogen oxidase
MIWDSSVFSNNCNTRLTAMVRPEAKEPVEEALSATLRHLGIRENPSHTHLFQAEQAIPQFEVGHAQKMEQLLAKARGIPMLGNYFQGASVEAAISRSRSAI